MAARKRQSTDDDARRSPAGSQNGHSDPRLELVPPQALDHEICVLGAMILDREVIGDVVQVLDTEDAFYVPQHRVMYRVLRELYERGQSIDLVILRQELTSRGLMDELGGPDFMVRLVESVPDVGAAVDYAKVVKDKSLLRDLIRVTGTTAHEAYTSSRPASEILDAAEKQMFEITHRREARSARPLQELLAEIFDHIEADGDTTLGFPTGFTQLDSMLHGLQRGEMIVVAARPSMGKTAFGLNVAEHLAMDAGIPTAVFSLEMSQQAVAMRILFSRAGVDSTKYRNRTDLTEADISRLQAVSNELQKAKLFVDDSVGLTPLELRAKCRRLKHQHDIQCVVVDYLQLMRDPGSESRQVEITNISSTLKQVSRELDVPVVALAQLNRGVESREGHKPRMSDLRESGAIEQDADVILLLHREEYYNQTDPNVQGKATIICAKQRNGPTGEVELQYQRELTRFRNLSYGHGRDYGPANGEAGDNGEWGGRMGDLPA